MSIEFVSVYNHPEAPRYLYDLMGERNQTVNISHTSIPTWDQHCAFVASRPYAEWNLIQAEGGIVGACYITKHDEIGIFIFKAHQRKGYGKSAVRKLLDSHPGKRMLANIAPGNTPSKTMFEAIGFRHIQNTYAKVG